MDALFWHGIGGKLVDRWAATSAPALVFWLGGAAAWLLAHGGVHAADGLARRIDSWSTPAQIAALFAGLVLVAASGVLVNRLTVPVLKLMEGYWPAFLSPLRRRAAARRLGRRNTLDDRFRQITPAVLAGTAPSEQQAEYALITTQLRRFPDSVGLLPTRLGNILLAGETHPADKYGLDAVRLWPHLWLLLPDATRTAVATARESLDRAVSATVWAVLFLGFAPLTLWAIPVGIVVVAASIWLWAPARAAVFADLVEAAFDLYRLDLYRRLRWPLPPNPAAERLAGAQLSEYLVRGTDKAEPTFTGDTA